MQRKATKTTRAANAKERAFAGFVKEQDCCMCDRPGPSIVDHIYGSTFKIKHNYVSVLAGPWLILPMCPQCDNYKTKNSHRLFYEVFGVRQVDIWLSWEAIEKWVPLEVYQAVEYRLTNPI